MRPGDPPDDGRRNRRRLRFSLFYLGINRGIGLMLALIARPVLRLMNGVR